MERIGVALIGAGWFGEFHAQVISENPVVSFKAVADVNEARARELAEKYGAAAWYGDVQNMLRSEDIEAVTIATPEQHHRGPAVAAAETGKHILLEKPIAPTLEDADAIINAAKKAKVKLQIGYELRFDPRYAQAKYQIDAGALGEVLSIYMRRNTSIVTPKRVGKWSHPLFYMAVHDFDMMRWYVGSEPRTVYAQSENKVLSKLGLQYPDLMWAIFKFKDEAVGVTETNWVLPENFPSGIDGRMNVIGTRGAVCVDVMDQGLRVVSEKGFQMPDTLHWPVIHGRLMGDLREEFIHFIDCIMKNKEPIVTGIDGRRSLEMALGVKKSLEEEKIVTFPL